jgi:[acyl-carrier-protein] S-malonyltransferase
MERAAEAHPGGMLAIVAGSDTAAHEALACGRAHGEIVLAARNSVDQWVLSGDEAALRRVAAAFPATRLPVQGPWHSPAMASAAEEWLFALLAIPRTRGHAGFVANRDGRLVTDEERIPHLLAGQLTQAVAWYETMITLGEAGVTHAVIMGPGRALRGLLRRHFGERLRVLLTEDESDISSTIEVLRS